MVEEIKTLVEKGAKIVFYYKYGGGTHIYIHIPNISTKVDLVF